MAKDKKLDDKKSSTDEKSTGKDIAKKDFRIVHNEVDITIHAGDDVSKVPVQYRANLRTEGVID